MNIIFTSLGEILRAWINQLYTEFPLDFYQLSKLLSKAVGLLNILTSDTHYYMYIDYTGYEMRFTVFRILLCLWPLANMSAFAVKVLFFFFRGDFCQVVQISFYYQSVRCYSHKCMPESVNCFPLSTKTINWFWHFVG